MTEQMTHDTDPATGDLTMAVRALTKTYGSGRTSFTAVEDLSFDVPGGEFTCVVGPSGAGKTTLLKCISGLLAPSAGVVEFEGLPINGPPEGLALVFQDYSRSLLPWATVERNVEHPLRALKLPKAERIRRTREALAAVGLSVSHGKYPWQLSGGMQQRVAIARALAYRPVLLLMDEPFASVDAQTREDLEDLVRGIQRDYEITTMLVTHDIDEAIYLADRVLVLSSSPARLLESVPVDLGEDREQVATKADPHFAALRTKIHGLVRRTQFE